MAKVFVSSVINAPVAEVWAKIRDFNAMSDWHAGVAASHIENDEPGDRIGCVRYLTLGDGGIIREKLLGFSDAEYFHTYSILESPLPLDNYVATLRLRPITHGSRTYIEWSAMFDCVPQEQENMIALLGDGVYQPGLNSLDTLFGK